MHCAVARARAPNIGLHDARVRPRSLVWCSLINAAQPRWECSSVHLGREYRADHPSIGTTCTNVHPLSCQHTELDQGVRSTTSSVPAVMSTHRKSSRSVVLPWPAASSTIERCRSNVPAGSATSWTSAGNAAPLSVSIADRVMSAPGCRRSFPRRHKGRHRSHARCTRCDPPCRAPK